MKLEWNFFDRVENKRLEKAMQRCVKSLYRLCKKNNLPYADIYILSSQGSTSLNIRAKDKKKTGVIDEYAFIKKEI